MKKILMLFLGLIFAANSFAVNSSESKVNVPNRYLLAKFKQPKAKVVCVGKELCKSLLLADFYKDRGYQLAWINDGKLTPNGRDLVSALKNSFDDGFDPTSFHISQINKMVKLLNNDGESILPELTVDLDITLTDGLLLYLNNLTHGLYNSKKIYPEWPITKKDINILDVAKNTVESSDVLASILTVAPKYDGYMGLRDQLDQYYQVARAGGWKKIPDGDKLEYGDSGDSVLLLQKRLLASGELAEIDHEGKFDKSTKQAVIDFQANNGLTVDGSVGGATLKALNVSVGSRIRQIELNMDRIRFLPDKFPDKYVLVNVPGYYLVAYESGEQKLNFPVVVGQPPKHKTCILDSQINTVEINPYWNIPGSIAANDLLPQIQEDNKYLSDTQTKVFKKIKGHYEEVDPQTIDWKHMESTELTNLTYKFRQDPGSENQLGVLKFIFPNSCGIYLHDSLYTDLFDDTDRGLSHGCVRVSEPLDLATFILDNNQNLDNNQISKKIDSKKHEFVKVASPVNLYIVYITAWYDSTADYVQFRDDIYGNDKLSLYPLYLPKTKILHHQSDGDN